MSLVHKDVNLEPTWVVIYEYMMRRKTRRELKALIDRYPRMLAARLRDMSRVREGKRFHKYPDTWEPLTTWNTIERGVIAQLGHGFHLREVGRYSRFAAFGSDAFKAGFINNPIGRFITSPADGYKNVRFVAKRCVTNKEMGFVQTARGKGYIVMRHNRAVADPFFDFWSVSSFIVGHGDSVNLFWRQDVGEGAESTVVAVNVFRVLQQEAPDARVRFIDRQLIIDDEVYGEVVYVRLDESGSILDTSNIVSLSVADSIPVIKITRTYETPCGVCKTNDRVDTHPLLSENQLFQVSDDAEHQIPNSAFRVEWKARWVDYVKPYTSQFVVKKLLLHAEQETQLTEVRHELDTTKQQLDALKTVVARILPNEHLAMLFAEGNLSPFTRDAVVLQFDIVGCTALIEKYKWTDADQARHIGKLVSECLRAGVKRGGWDFSISGDGGIMVFCPTWPTKKKENPLESMTQAAVEAIRSAYEMHAAAHSYVMQLRIGIHAGGITWRQNGAFLDDDIITPRFAANGTALNLASRLEQSLKEHDPPLSGHTRVSQQVMELMHTPLILKTARLDSNMKLMGFMYDGVVQVKTDRIECWSRRETPETLIDEVDILGMEEIEVLELPTRWKRKDT